MTAVSRHFQRWTRWHLVAAIIFAAMGSIIVSSALADIYEKAIKDEENSHILLVPVVAMWMVWVRASRIRYCRPSWTIIGPVVVAIGWFFWSYGYWQNRDTFFHFGAILVVLGCILSVLGRHVLMRFFPAVAVLLFLVPVPTHVRQKIAIPMQAFTARVSQTSMEVMGVDVKRDGNSLTVNGQSVMIIEACNGMRMVFPLLLIAYGFAFGLPLRASIRWIIVLASPLVALACNVLRVLPLVWLQGQGPNGQTPGAYDEAYITGGQAGLSIPIGLARDAAGNLSTLWEPLRRPVGQRHA